MLFLLIALLLGCITFFFQFSIWIYNSVNIYSYNLHKPKLFGIFSDFRKCKGDLGPKMFVIHSSDVTVKCNQSWVEVKRSFRHECVLPSVLPGGGRARLVFLAPSGAVGLGWVICISVAGFLCSAPGFLSPPPTRWRIGKVWPPWAGANWSLHLAPSGQLGGLKVNSSHCQPFRLTLCSLGCLKAQASCTP